MKSLIYIYIYIVIYIDWLRTSERAHWILFCFWEHQNEHIKQSIGTNVYSSSRSRPKTNYSLALTLENETLLQSLKENPEDRMFIYIYIYINGPLVLKADLSEKIFFNTISLENKSLFQSHGLVRFQRRQQKKKNKQIYIYIYIYT